MFQSRSQLRTEQTNGHQSQLFNSGWDRGREGMTVESFDRKDELCCIYTSKHPESKTRNKWEMFLQGCMYVQTAELGAFSEPTTALEITEYQQGRFFPVLTVRQEILCPECIFRQRDVSADRPVVEGEDLSFVLELVVRAERLKEK
jgi:hypothetical protein